MSIEREMRQVLAEMEVWFQYGTTVNWAPSTTSGEKTYGRPPGSSWAAHDFWRDKYENAINHIKVVAEATEALEQMRKQKPLEVELETQAQLEQRIVAEGVGWSLQDIANHCRVTPKMARKARERLNMDPETGKPRKALRKALTPRQEQARLMRDRGLTLKQIGTFLGCDAATVHRDLAQAA